MKTVGGACASLLALLLAVIALYQPAQAEKSVLSTSAVVDTYADIALAKYEDSLTTGRALQEAIEAFLAAPSDETLTAARTAWLTARVQYQQTEVFRFGNPIVDDWEGRVNAWPLDEGLIDYVSTGYGGPTDENPYASLNVVASPRFMLSGVEIDATEITPALIMDTLHEADEVEANVASGYHAIEFLLWGQDLNGFAPGAGERPYTDYAIGGDCTGGNCERRAAYLRAATTQLITDLEWIVDQWDADGAARAALTADPDAGVIAIFTGMGSLSYGELAGERMKLGLMLHDPEEEHDCFADNTHNSHYYNGVGIRSIYLGRYTRIDGSVVQGPSVSDLVAAAAPDVDAALRVALDGSVEKLGEIKAAAEAGMPYDAMLEPGNEEGGALITAAVDALVGQTREIERAVAALDLAPIPFEGSDSLDNPSAVFE